MKTIRAFLRLLYFAFYTSLRITQIVLASLLLGEDPRRGMRIRQKWANHMLPALGIHIEVRGTPPDFPCILMGNHRSYLDPPLLVRYVLGFPVSKAEVERWPVIGYGSKVSGVLFLKRESKSSRRRTLERITEKVQAGFPVILFPEGTTQAGMTTMPFKPGAFDLAAANDIPVVALAVEYRDPADYWVGDDTFLAHFFRRFGERRMQAYLHFGPSFRNDDPEILLQQVKAWIDAELLRIQAGFMA